MDQVKKATEKTEQWVKQQGKVAKAKVLELKNKMKIPEEPNEAIEEAGNSSADETGTKLSRQKKERGKSPERNKTIRKAIESGCCNWQNGIDFDDWHYAHSENADSEKAIEKLPAQEDVQDSLGTKEKDEQGEDLKEAKNEENQDQKQEKNEKKESNKEQSGEDETYEFLDTRDLEEDYKHEKDIVSSNETTEEKNLGILTGASNEDDNQSVFSCFDHPHAEGTKCFKCPFIFYPAALVFLAFLIWAIHCLFRTVDSYFDYVC